MLGAGQHAHMMSQPTVNFARTVRLENSDVVEGNIMFYVAGDSFAVSDGTTVFVSRGQEHSFTVENDTAETLILFTPAGTENFFKEISVPAHTCFAVIAGRATGCRPDDGCGRQV